MSCVQCQGVEEVFSQRYVTKELSRYRAKGPDKTTRMLIEAIKDASVAGETLLDIGGGLGAVQHGLLDVGLEHATDVDASTAYLNAAKAEAKRRGLADRVSYQHGNFVDMAEQVEPADIVTLDRVICCYPEMEKLVSLSAERARKVYGLVYPRDSWWIRLGLALGNLFLKIRRSAYRGFVHPARAVEAIVRDNGLERCFYRQTLVWQVVVYRRSSSSLTTNPL